MNGRKVIVVGGGAAGLGATYTLRKRGIDVTLLESSGHTGGRMAGEVVDGFCIDTGAQLFSTAYTVPLQMCEELGVPLERSPVNPPGGVYNRFKGKLGVVDSSSLVNLTTMRTLLSFTVFSPRALWQFQKFARFMLKRRKDFTTADHLRVLDLDYEGTFADWARRNFGEEFLTQACHFPVASVTLSTPDQLSPLHGMMLLWMVFLERRHKIRMPEQGVGFFARRLAEACAPDTRLSTPVERIVIEGGVVRGVQTADGFMDADAVVCATNAITARQIAPDLPGYVTEFLANVRYATCCHIVFGVENHPLPDGAFMFMFQRPDDSFLDCYLDSTLGSPQSAPEGKGIIHAYVSGDHARQLFDLTDEEIKERVLREIRAYTPEMPEEPLFTRVYRWESAVCLPHGGMMQEIQALRAQGLPGVEGLFLAGEYLRLLSSLNGALTTGVEAAGEVERFLAGRPPQEPEIAGKRASAQ